MAAFTTTTTRTRARTTATEWAHADLWGPPQHKPWTGKDIWWAALCLFVTNAIAAAPAVVHMFNHPEENPYEFAYNPVVLAGGMLALWIVFAGYPLFVTMTKGARSLASDFGWTFRRKDLLVGLVAGLALRVLDIGIGEGAGKVIDLTDGDNANWLTMPRPMAWTVAFALGAALIAPALEELFFRGFVMKTFQRLRRVPARWATAVGVICSSVLFGAMHTTAMNAGGIYVAVITGSIGAVLAVMTVRTGRLGPAVATHVIFNATGVVLALAG